jgi:hypothetical protein
VGDVLASVPLCGSPVGAVTSVQLSPSTRFLLLGHGVRKSRQRSPKDCLRVLSLYQWEGVGATTHARAAAAQAEAAEKEAQVLALVQAQAQAGGAGCGCGAGAGGGGDGAAVGGEGGEDGEGGGEEGGGGAGGGQSGLPLHLLLEARSGEDDVNLALFHPHEGLALLYGTGQGKLRTLDFEQRVAEDPVAAQEAVAWKLQDSTGTELGLPTAEEMEPDLEEVDVGINGLLVLRTPDGQQGPPGDMEARGV